ncbi:MAG TPA: cupin domain-containing protein [Pseudonocardiaceae bacterium]|nr:cupin domain-containing protein [Pseudonocardiaceae bacterium]
MISLRRAALAGVLLAGGAALVAPGVANATPSRGVTGTILSQTTVDGKDYILRRITIDPGGSTGWHYHDGTLYAVVEQGTLTHDESNCQVDGSYGAGSFFIEPSGSGHVHIGRNLGSTPVILEVLYVDPAGSPLSEDAPNPGCSFQ